MKNAPDHHWQPDPQLLAAYFDGELEGRDDIADLRARLETWLEEHPEVANEWANRHQLQNLWLKTTPAEPTAATWNHTLEQIAARRQLPIDLPTSKRPWLTAGIVAASIMIFVGLLFGALRIMTPNEVKNEPVAVVPKVNPPAEDVEVFPVASAQEIVIRRIEGADTSLLVVGAPPVIGPLELAAPGEVRVVNLPADATNVFQSGQRPMIWAKLDTE
jgi:hypothetical protein